jgi:hypothetical protein
MPRYIPGREYHTRTAHMLYILDGGELKKECEIPIDEKVIYIGAEEHTLEGKQVTAHKVLVSPAMPSEEEGYLVNPQLGRAR